MVEIASFTTRWVCQRPIAAKYGYKPSRVYNQVMITRVFGLSLWCRTFYPPYGNVYKI